MEKIWSYPKVWRFGHKNVRDVMVSDYYIQEKIDGSQISWRWLNGELYVRSKNKIQYGDGAVPDAMFVKAIEIIKSLPVYEGYVFRAEYLKDRKHNVLEYDRVPKNHLVLFDVEFGPGDFLHPENVKKFAERLGIEFAPILFKFDIPLTEEGLEEIIDRESFLGGAKIEGIVIKNYQQRNRHGNPLFAKYVSNQFRELNTKAWKPKNKRNIAEEIIDILNSEARFRKVYRRLLEEGELTGELKDIEKLLRAFKQDVLEEEIDWIKDMLWEAHKGYIMKKLGRGLPEWYKSILNRKE